MNGYEDMSEDDSITDKSPPETCTFTGDELVVPSKWFESVELADMDCSRPVWEEAASDRCVWHTDQADKPLNELIATVGDGCLPGARVPDVNFSECEFEFPENSVLISADMTGASLREIDLTGANLVYANLSGADLTEAKLCEACLRAADLTGSSLSGADLTGADLSGVDLAGGDLRAAELPDALLTEVTLTDVSISRSTDIDAPESRIRRVHSEELTSSEVWDLIARTNHKLGAAYSENGLSRPARRAYVRERRARRKEALAEGDWQGRVAWGWSLLSKIFTGYGVQLRWISAVMLLLYLASAGVYWWQGMTPGRALYYSVVTFTTSPPEPPPPGVASIVAGVETFAGTAAIVLLGYVLGTRERT